METARLIAEWVTAIATGVVAVAAWIQLPLISQQVRGLSEQIRLSREAEINAERRMREWETLKACQRYDYDPVLDAATRRIWVASENGANYRNPAVDKRDVVCVVNYLDDLATGIAQNLYIEDIVKDHVSSIFKHAIENFVHTKVIDTDGIEKVVAVYERWFHMRPAPTGYIAGSRHGERGVT